VGLVGLFVEFVIIEKSPATKTVDFKTTGN
jgi:hypothetical protein